MPTNILLSPKVRCFQLRDLRKAREAVARAMTIMPADAYFELQKAQEHIDLAVKCVEVHHPPKEATASGKPRIFSDASSPTVDEILEQAVLVLRETLRPVEVSKIRAAISMDPDTWWSAEHFFWGMTVRNLLRDRVCLDEKLPTGNWDDLYVRAVEMAVKE